VTDSPDSADPTDPAESTENPEVEEVRRLLADARHTAPMPADVAARMDAVLAGLRSEEAPGSPVDRPTEVVPLAPHRRRRAATLLVAAATIVVGGVVVAQQLPSGTSASETGASSAQDAGGVRSPEATTFGNSGGDVSKRAHARPLVRHGRVVVHPRRFASDALAGRTLLTQPGTASDRLEVVRCAAVPTGDGTVLGATYRQAPAALVYRRPSGNSQVVDLYVCGSANPVRSTTLPAP
jgi:hypothetical protein